MAVCLRAVSCLLLSGVILCGLSTCLTGRPVFYFDPVEPRRQHLFRLRRSALLELSPSDRRLDADVRDGQ